MFLFLCATYLGGCCGTNSSTSVKLVDSRSRPISGAVIRAENISMSYKSFCTGVAVSDEKGVATFIAGQNYSTRMARALRLRIIHKDFLPVSVQVRLIEDKRSIPEIVLTKRGGASRLIQGLLMNSRDMNDMQPTFLDELLYGLSTDEKSAVRTTWMNAVRSERQGPSEYELRQSRP